MIGRRFTAILFLSQFGPRSESADRTLSNSLSGTFAARSEMARELFSSAGSYTYVDICVPAYYQLSSIDLLSY